MPEEKTFVIGEALMNEVLAILGSRPYTEVAGTINRLAQAINPARAELVPFPEPKGKKE